MDIKDYKVGQTVYIKLTGNARRGKSDDALIEEWEIIYIGRKLIKAKRKGMSDAFAETFEKRNYGCYSELFVQRTDRCVDYIMYADRKEIAEEIEKKELISFISNYFHGYGDKNISIDSLRKIRDLITNTTEN